MRTARVKYTSLSFSRVKNIFPNGIRVFIFSERMCPFMFNPYSVRPIGSAKFERHLMDIQTRRYYETILSTDEEITGEDIHGREPWKIPDSYNPWANLYTAIWALTIMDYLDNYLKRNAALRRDDDAKYWVFESRCIQIENFFFRVDEFGNELLNKMLYNICWMGDNEIEACMKRMKKVLRWSVTARKTRKKHVP